MSQIVQVVSIELVTIEDGEIVDQQNDVNGAVTSPLDWDTGQRYPTHLTSRLCLTFVKVDRSDRE